MIKLKKIVAVALTAAMCLGLSMTAFAAKNDDWSNDDLWSPVNIRGMGPGGKDLNWQTEAGYIVAKDAKGHSVDISWKELSNKTLESIDGEGKVAEIFKKNGYDVPDDTDFIPLLSGNITFDYGVPEGGGVVTFALRDLGLASESVKPGDTVYVMQETTPGSGVWEVFAAEVGPNYDINVTLPRNGSLVLLKTMSDGTVIALDKATGDVIGSVPADNVANNNAANNNATGTKTSSTAATAATSPKTGEF